MTREDIDNIISIICPNDEDFEKPIISPAYLKKELEALALEEEPCSNCCNGNQIEKAKLCQKSYLAGMEHKQEPKTGHWITQWNVAHQKEYYYCSECREEFSYDGETGIKMNDYNYCPNCGAKMVEPQEERDKE